MYIASMLNCLMDLPFTKCIDVDISKGLFAAVEELSLSGHTLKLDLVIIVHLLTNRLNLDPWMETKDAPNAILPLKKHLQIERDLQ